VIVTFYSYKGGVGRSFCLANVAVLLSRWGRRVLCVDWDLEAPGLHSYFKPWLARTPQAGLVELVAGVRAGGELHWRPAVVPVKVPGARRLDLLAAGRVDDTYIDRVQQISWTELYDQNDLGNHIERLRRELLDEYDIVLVDSRTGITDIGGICTVQLPDLLVLCFTANQQSLGGVLEVAHRAAAARDRLPYDRAGLVALPLLARFDAREEYDRAGEWRAKVADGMAELYRRWAPKGVEPLDLVERTTVPYLSVWSFGEEVPAVTERTGNPELVTYSLETVAALLAHGLRDADTLVANRDSYVQAAQSGTAHEAHFEYDVFIPEESGHGERAREVGAALDRFGLRVLRTVDVGAGSQVWSPAQAVGTAQHLLLVHPDGRRPWTADLIRRFESAARSAASPRLIMPVYGTDASGRERLLLSYQAIRDEGQDAAEIAAVVVDAVTNAALDDAAQTDRDRWAQALVAAGLFARDRGADQLAEDRLRRATFLSPHRPEPYAALGELLVERGRFEEADKQLRRALGTAPRHSAIAPVVSYRLGVVARQLGAMDSAREHLTLAVEQSDRTNPVRIVALQELADLARSEGNLVEVERLERIILAEAEDPGPEPVASPQHMPTSLPALLSSLTSAERDILAAIARGDSNARIASRLGVTETTVRTHLSRIYAKLRVSDRVGAALVARDAGIDG